MEMKIDQGAYWVRWKKPSAPEVAYWNGHTWLWWGVTTHDLPAEVICRVPSSEESKKEPTP